MNEKLIIAGTGSFVAALLIGSVALVTASPGPPTHELSQGTASTQATTTTGAPTSTTTKRITTTTTEPTTTTVNGYYSDSSNDSKPESTTPNRSATPIPKTTTTMTAKPTTTTSLDPKLAVQAKWKGQIATDWDDYRYYVWWNHQACHSNESCQPAIDAYMTYADDSGAFQKINFDFSLKMSQLLPDFGPRLSCLATYGDSTSTQACRDAESKEAHDYLAYVKFLQAWGIDVKP